jgi:hypothetical protein
MIGLLEASQGFGITVGPIIGTGLFALAGYNFMLYSFGGLFLLIGIFVYILIPPFVDSTHQDEMHGTSALDMNVSGVFSYQRRLSYDQISHGKLGESQSPIDFNLSGDRSNISHPNFGGLVNVEDLDETGSYHRAS